MYSLFCKLRSDPSLSAEEFASKVFATPLFENKTLLVRKVLGNLWPSSDLEDAMQDALMRVYLHLVNRRGNDFTGISDDCLGSWMFRLIRRNATWELQHQRRKNGRREKRERVAARNEKDTPSSVSLIPGILERLFVFIDELPHPDREIAWDWWTNVPIISTAKRLRVRREKIYRIRQRLILFVKKLIANDF